MIKLLTYQMIVQVWELLFVIVFILGVTLTNYWVCRMSHRNFRAVMDLMGARDDV